MDSFELCTVQVRARQGFSGSYLTPVLGARENTVTASVDAAYAVVIYNRSDLHVRASLRVGDRECGAYALHPDGDVVVDACSLTGSEFVFSGPSPVDVVVTFVPSRVVHDSTQFGGMYVRPPIDIMDAAGEWSEDVSLVASLRLVEAGRRVLDRVE